MLKANSRDTYNEERLNNEHLNTGQLATPTPDSRLKQVIASMQKFATVSEVLRVLGAAIMIGGMSVFLMRGWQVGNDIHRYLLLLMQTVLLTGGGFALSALLKEYKGARLFFGLSLASVAANFTILGALIYSIVQFDGMLTSYPGFATWVIDPSELVLTIVGAIAVLAPVTWLAYSILARSSSRWLTLCYLGAASLLLLPVRSPLYSSLLALLSIGFALYFLKLKGNKDDALQTAEGGYARLMLFLPAVILFCRSWIFYQADVLAIAMVFAAIYLALRHLSRAAPAETMRHKWFNVLSVPVIMGTALFLVAGLENYIANQMMLPFYALVALPMFADLMATAKNPGQAKALGVFGALSVCVGLVFNEVYASGFIPALASIVGTLTIVVYGYLYKQKELMQLGLVSLAVVLLFNFGEFISLFDFNNWAVLTVIGASAIILASVLDRYGATLRLRFDTLRHRHIPTND